MQARAPLVIYRDHPIIREINEKLDRNTLALERLEKMTALLVAFCVEDHASNRTPACIQPLDHACKLCRDARELGCV
jgi:hypothetical protein